MATTTNKRGRPEVTLDSEQVQMLASFGCTLPEMSAFFKIAESTLRRKYSDAIQSGKEVGKVRLRKKQWEIALSGNTTMLIWLGKQILGQSEKQDINHSNLTDNKIIVEWGLINEPNAKG